MPKPLSSRAEFVSHTAALIVAQNATSPHSGEIHKSPAIVDRAIDLASLVADRLEEREDLDEGAIARAKRSNELTQEKLSEANNRITKLEHDLENAKDANDALRKERDELKGPPKGKAAEGSKPPEGAKADTGKAGAPAPK